MKTRDEEVGEVGGSFRRREGGPKVERARASVENSTLQKGALAQSQALHQYFLSPNQSSQKTLFQVEAWESAG